MNNFLVTYRNERHDWDFYWFHSEEELQEWLNEYKDKYSEIEAVELNVIRTVYSGK